jgi:hypothetical protein
MKKIIEIDDIVSPLYQNHIKNTLLNCSFNWNFIEDLTSDDRNFYKEKHPGFSHVFFNEGEIKSQHHHMILPLIFQVADKIGLDTVNLLRSRTFLHLPSKKEVRNNFHTDYLNNINHLSCIYYVKSSDGCTVISDKTNKECDDPHILTDENVDIKIKPEQGKVIIFNGHWYHCSSNPTIDTRCIISFNFLI